MKIVINDCYGGFNLSHAAIMRYAELKPLKLNVSKSMYSSIDYTYSIDTDQYWSHWDIARDDPVLVHVVEELGEAANDRFCKLKIVEIPDDVEWILQEVGGKEWIAEAHRTWK